MVMMQENVWKLFLVIFSIDLEAIRLDQRWTHCLALTETMAAATKGRRRWSKPRRQMP
jgi:hypothetical protein